MEYRQMFATYYPNSNNITSEPYGFKIEYPSGEALIPSYGNLAFYQMRLNVNITSGDPSFDTSVGSFFSSPNGKYKVTYKVVLDGVEQERTELMDFFPYVPAPVSSNQSNTLENFPEPADNNNEEPRYPSMKELAEKATTDGEKRMYKLLANYQLEHLYEQVRGELSGFIEPYWPTLHREIIVFRGQTDPMVQEINSRRQPFFSTSLHELVSTSSEFMSHKDNCCLFVLHIQPGVKYFSYVGDIDKAIAIYNEKRAKPTGNFFWGNSSAESEVLIAGGGTFFQDKEKKKPGFREMSFEEMTKLGVTNVPMPLKVKTLFGPRVHTKGSKKVEQKTGVFEAYYFPPEKTKGGVRKGWYARTKKVQQKRGTRKTM